MLAMSNIYKAEILLSESDYDNLKSFFAGKSNWTKKKFFGSFEDGSEVSVHIDGLPASRCADVTAQLFVNGVEVARESYAFKKISLLNGIFSFELTSTGRKYIFRIKKDLPISKDALMNRFNIAKWNSFKEEYIENILQYNDWTNEIDLFEVAFTSLIGLSFKNSNSKKDELTEYIINKLSYYGYDYGEVEYIDGVKISEDVINNLIYYLLNQLNQTDYIANSKEAEGLAYECLEEFLNEFFNEYTF